MTMDTNCDKQGPVVLDADGLGSSEFDERLVDWLALGYTHERAGAEVGRSAKWVQRRLTPELKARVAIRKRDLHAKTWEATFALRDSGVKRLESLIGSDDDRVALSAIRLVFDISVRLRGEQAYQDLSDQVLELDLKVNSAAAATRDQQRALETREVEVQKREADVAASESKIMRLSARQSSVDEV